MSQLAHERLGRGDPVVLIHGIGHRKETWLEVARRLARTHEVIGLDLPGHGKSPMPDAAPTLRGTTDQIERLIGSLGLGRPHVVGNSLGGAMALELAHRGTIATCTAISPAGFAPRHHLPLTAAALLSMRGSTRLPRAIVRRASHDARLRRLTLRALYEHPERIDGDHAYADALNLRNAAGFWPFFRDAMRYRPSGAPACPTTIAWGTRDRMLPPSQAHRAMRQMSGAELVMLPDAGHCPQGDTPQRVADVVRSTMIRASGAR